jgi:hypothetical protein
MKFYENWELIPRCKAHSENGRSFVLFLVSWNGVRLSPLGKSATIWPTVPAPVDDEC